MKQKLLLIVAISFSSSSFSFNQSERTEQLATLCKIWGYQKYFDTRISQGIIDWDSVLVKNFPLFYDELSKKEYNELLNRSFLQGPLKSFSSDTQTSIRAIKWIETSTLLDPENKELLLSKLDSVPSSRYYVDNSKGPRNCSFPNEKKYRNLNFPNKEYQLLTLFRYWNAIHYFFPYKDLMDEDWEKILLTYLPQFFNSEHETEFHKLVFRLTTELRDTHVQTGSNVINVMMGYYFPDFRLKYIGNQYVIQSYLNDSLREISPARVGDVVLEMDGISIQALDSNLRYYYRASNPAATNKYVAEWILLNEKDSSLLKAKRGNDTLEYVIEKRLQKDRNVFKVSNRQRPPLEFIREDIAYIDIGKLYKPQIDSLYELIKPTKGLIIDMRAYPNGTYYLLCSRLIKEDSLTFAAVNYANLDIPGEFSPGIPIKIRGDSCTHYKGIVALLINEDTQSQGEFSTMALENVPEAIKIGSQTAGADGNVSVIHLPFGIVTTFSGLRVTYPGGTPTQRFGIVPDITIEPQFEDIVQQKDPQLERAIEYINKNK